MIAECNPLEDPAGCVGDVVGGVIGNAASSAWESVCKSFADSAIALLDGFAKLFVNFPDADLTSVAQPNGPYAISMWIAGAIAVILLLGQVIRTAVTNDGSAVATALVGAGKLLLAIVATLTIASTAMTASDEISKGIINSSLGGNEGLRKALTGLFTFTTAGAAPGQAKLVAPASLVLILALVGTILTLVLWFEMLLRNAAILVLIGTAPIAAAGQMSESTRSWWTKLCVATLQLIILKPVITLIFAVGFGILSKPADVTKPNDIATILAGMLILLLAVVAWPVIARFFTFTQASFAGGGMAGMLGFAAGRANAGSGPVGVKPSEFSQATEARTMAASGAGESASLMGAGGASGGMNAAGGAGASGGAAAGAGALGAVAGPLAVAAAGVDVAQRAVNSLSGRMEQMAGHAGIHGAHPHARPAGHNQYSGSWSSPGGSIGGAAQQAAPVEPDRSAHVASAPAQPGAMPESRGPEYLPADLPRSVPIPAQHVYTSPIEEVGR